MASTIWSGSKSFTAAGGSETVVPVPMPHRGILRGYSLVQVTGGNDGFAADLYSSNQATAPNSTLPAEVFHVLSLSEMADVVVDPDVVAIAENTSINVAYHNRDGSPSLAQRFLYLRITPNGTGAKNFVVSVTVETPMLR
jgi:hypothetical protein